MTSSDVWQLLTGLITSLQLTFASLLIGGVFAVVATSILVLRVPVLTRVVQGYIIVFTGTPLLVQIFLIYYGPGQFELVRESFAWKWLSEPWFCAVFAFSLNTAAYTAQLFKGAFESISSKQIQACQALGMGKYTSLRILLPYALFRSVPAYSNEIILVFKGTSLASTITIMDLMGYAQRINSQTYDTLAVFGLAGLFYLIINGFLALFLRYVEKKALAFER